MTRPGLTAPGRTGTVFPRPAAQAESQDPMISIATLWIPFTIVASLGQVARNAMQRQLTGPLGTWGATNIRFLFGFPFSLLFFGCVIVFTGDAVPWPGATFWPWLLLGALSQILGTGLMLAAMNDRSFVVTTAYLKTEAIQTAIFGFVFLGDHLTAAQGGRDPDRHDRRDRHRLAAGRVRKISPISGRPCWVSSQRRRSRCRRSGFAAPSSWCPAFRS